MQAHQLVNRLLSKGAVSLLQSTFRRLNNAEREELALRLVETAFGNGFEHSIASTDKAPTGDKSNAFLRERLLSLACSNLDAASIPHVLIEYFSKVSGGSLHYSQEGEDLLLNRLFDKRADGFYVDIGAHHATRYSNTFALYRRGWRGINVDATPGSMDSFRALRPRDISLELLISDRSEPLRMHLFREGALNTTNAALAQSYVAAGWEKTGEVELVPRTLASLMDEHVPAAVAIDLLSIDVEAEELAVLRSGNWKAYRPSVVIIEVLSTHLVRLPDEPAVRFLIEQGYEPRFRLFNSVVLAREPT
jgi:FkbM family methyltransferase